MKVDAELKKVNIATNLQSAEILISYHIDDYKLLDKFKEKLTDFIMYLEGQKTLIPK